MELIVLLNIVIKVINTTDNSAFTCVNINGPMLDYDPNVVTELVEKLDWDLIYRKLNLGELNKTEISELKTSLLLGLGKSMLQDITTVHNSDNLLFDVWTTSPTTVHVNDRLRVHVKLATRTQSLTSTVANSVLH